jgi:SAM-dependent MidA family methyltransferase
MRQRQRARFEGAALAVDVVAGPEGLDDGGAPTVLHASELYDAMPVHRVVQRPDGLQELRVMAGADGLGWREAPAAQPLCDYLAGHRVSLVDNQVAEINLGARSHHRQTLAALAGDGVALLLDYGYEAVRLYNPRGRRGGSLACYREHRLSRDPLLVPGQQDITAHVNWDDLRLAAEEAGWCEVGLWPLAEALVRGGLAAELELAGLGSEAELDSRVVSERQEVKRLLDPDGMGSDLKMLVQATPAMVAAVQEVFALP